MARPTLTFAELRARHDHPKAGHCERARARHAARSAAKRMGVAVPEWARPLALAVRRERRRPACTRTAKSANAAGPRVHIAWAEQLTELRRFAGPGAVVGIGASGIMIDRIGQPRRTWPDYDSALAELTAP